MDSEEILIKLGFKTDGIQQGAQQVGHAMKKAGEESEFAFVHAESKGKTFKKILHEISDTSPLLGLALRAALDPVVAIMVSITMAFKAVDKAFEDSDKRLEKMAEKEAKHQVAIAEANERAAESIRKRGDAQDEFERGRASGFRKEAATDAYTKSIEQAKEASGGDEAEFLRRKMLIDKQEKQRIESEDYKALLKNKELEGLRDTEEQLAARERLKERLKELSKEEEEAIKKQQKMEMGAGGGLSGAIKRLATGSIIIGGKSGPWGFGFEDPQAQKAEDEFKKQHFGLSPKEWVEKLKKEREEISRGLMESESREATLSAEQKAAQKTASETPEKLADINRRISKNAQDLIEQERKLRHEATEQAIKEARERAQFNDVLFLKDKIHIEEKSRDEAIAHNDLAEKKRIEKELLVDALALKKAEAEHDRRQAAFNREYGVERRKRNEAERQPFMPTLDELAKSMPWQRDVIDEARRRSDSIMMRSGLAYGQRFAGQAQELERLKDDAKRALFVEGPESTRFKEDVKRIESLKKGLAAAGLQTSDDRLESIDRHMQTLLERASKEGLVVQPVNGN